LLRPVHLATAAPQPPTTATTSLASPLPLNQSLLTAMADKVVTEDFLKDTMNGLVSKEKFQSDIDRLISSVTDVNKTVAALSAKLDDHMKKAELDAGSFRQETSRLNTKIDNVQTQLLEKHDRFDRSSTSGDSSGPPPPAPVHKLRFPKYDGIEDPLGWLHKCEQFFRSQGTPLTQ
jgi:outer membrane murein-binding lipoprotein Lpp